MVAPLERIKVCGNIFGGWDCINPFFLTSHIVWAKIYRFVRVFESGKYYIFFIIILDLK
ncbi:hypothetical protein HZS_677, partial [Henneguya salminicola]